MSSPRSVRFDARVLEGLASYALRHPGLSGSAAAALLVDEGLRMDAHPGIVFRDGPTGRRAVLIGGPDAWEVIKAIRDAGAAEPALTGDELIDVVTQNSGVPGAVIQIALDYYGEYADEVDAMIDHVQKVEEAHQLSQRRARELLGS